MSNVIRRAQAQAAQANEGARRHVREEQIRKQGLDEGELLWIGEFKNKDMRAYKLTKGDKTLMTDKESKLFMRTQYERGFTEHIYEGQMKIIDPTKADPRDPRSATREGQGIMWYPNGSMYEGGWRNDLRHGHGYFCSNTGYKYTGDFDQDQPSGRQGYESGTSNVSYSGALQAGNPSGQGVLIYKADQPTYRYEGDFANGLRHGRGVVFYDNGDTFAGTFDMGKRHGRGITTTSSFGREVQYETEWDQDALVNGPTTIQSTKRVKKPKPSIPFSTRGHLVGADLTKWSVKDDVTELALEHFMKIKIGFEGLDAHGTGSLSTSELTAIWGTGSVAMLEKLDADGNGTVELDEIFAAWYPNVPSHNILRFMQQNVNPRALLRLRGMLNQVKDEADCGYLQVCGIHDLAHAEDDPALHQKQLEAHGYKIGQEKFSSANYQAAKQLFDPPHFLEVLEVWYPNIPKNAIARYEQLTIDPNELVLIKKDFYRLSGNNLQLLIENFEEAQEVFQQRIAKKYEEDEMKRVAAINATNAALMGGLTGFHQPPTTTVLEKKKMESSQKGEGKHDGNDDDDETTSVAPSTALNREGTADGNSGSGGTSAIEKEMEEGFFKGQPEWHVGNSIRLSVALLKDIDKFETRLHGTVTLQQLLRYCYPNVRCKRMQEILSTRKKGAGLLPAGGSTCTCQICTIV